MKPALEISDTDSKVFTPVSRRENKQVKVVLALNFVWKK